MGVTIICSVMPPTTAVALMLEAAKSVISSRGTWPEGTWSDGAFTVAETSLLPAARKS